VDFLGIGYDDTQNDQAQNRSDGIGPDYDNYFHHATMQVSSHPPGHEQHQQPEVATQEPLQREKRFHQAAPYTTSGTIPLTTEPISASIQADADSARLRAMEVVRKFQRPNHYNDNNDTGRNQGGRGSRSKNYQFDPYFDPYAAVELGRKRKECLELLKARERVALLKNLEYLSRVEDERLQERLLKIQQAQELERHMELQHKRRHESNARTGIGVNSRQSQAGIGTQQRQRVQEEQRNQYGPAAKRNEFASESVAIYVANLPRDGSADEELMRGLFSSYGNIRKIHFYVDKRTGQRKGDALVIYSLQQGQDRSALTESVCSQVRAKVGTVCKTQHKASLDGDVSCTWLLCHFHASSFQALRVVFNASFWYLCRTWDFADCIR